MPKWEDLNATRISPLVAWTDNGTDGVTLWHWCMGADPSDWASTPLPAAEVTSRSPLDVADAVSWTCCGLNGNVRHGRWTPA